jgi:hypothetical protein
MKAKNDWLFHMLKNVSMVFKSLGKRHFLSYGTLLGAMRYNDINPFEVDNDIIVYFPFEIDDDLRFSLQKHNLIIFEQHNIPRICTESNSVRPSNTPPWQLSKNCIYTDLYPTRVQNGIMTDRVMRDVSYDTRDFNELDTLRIRDTLFPALPMNVNMKLIKQRYGPDWMKPPSSAAHGNEKWKSELLERVSNKKI